MTSLPRRRSRPRMGIRQPSVIRCAAHLQFVRGFECAIKGRNGHTCDGKIEACHVRTGTNGGTGMKPGDEWCIAMCSWAHREQHRMGEVAFEKEYGIDMKAIAEKTAAKSVALTKYRRERMADASPERTDGN